MDSNGPIEVFFKLYFLEGHQEPMRFDLSLALRALFFTVLFPGTVTVIIPSWLLSTHNVSDGTPLRWLGAPLIVIGASGLLWCIRDFYSKGKGTLAPIDPPKHFVVSGLYRFVRNPMYVSVALILLGESFLFISPAILAEAGIFLVVTHLFVTQVEEPALRRQFGERYDLYLQTVGRWIPTIVGGK
jgi:protein-S-isoprenylcysteine O-methyltransferase Ste14